MASMMNGDGQETGVMRASMYRAAVEARCLLAMSVVLESINPEAAENRAISAWEKAHHVGFNTGEDEAMPLMFKGHETLENGFHHGQDWAYQMERAEAELAAEAWMEG